MNRGGMWEFLSFYCLSWEIIIFSKTFNHCIVLIWKLFSKATFRRVLSLLVGLSLLQPNHGPCPVHSHHPLLWVPQCFFTVIINVIINTIKSWTHMLFSQLSSKQSQGKTCHHNGHCQHNFKKENSLSNSLVFLQLSREHTESCS